MRFYPPGNVGQLAVQGGSFTRNADGTVDATDVATVTALFASGWLVSPSDLSGSGSPEGVVTAPVGATYARTDGDRGTALYVKESGTGKTGWVVHNSPKMWMTPEGGLAVRLTNKTGAASVKGTLVELDTTTDNAVKVADVSDMHVVGVVYESGIADGSLVWVVCSGIAEVLIKDGTAATRSYWVRTADVAGRADATTATPPGGGIPELDAHMAEIGHCLESKTSGTGVLVKIMMHFN